LAPFISFLSNVLYIALCTAAATACRWLLERSVGVERRFGNNKNTTELAASLLVVVVVMVVVRSQTQTQSHDGGAKKSRVHTRTQHTLHSFFVSPKSK